MKIQCSVEVINRALPSLNMAGKRAKKSILTIGKSIDGEPMIYHQTNESMGGLHYKVKNNVKKVFVKCLNEGKATIRFDEPNHDLAIKCDPIQLKGFLRTLKHCLDGGQTSQLSDINVNYKVIKPVKTKLSITKKEDYPVLEGFPRTLQALTINFVDAKRLDNRILRLQSLEVLNLENNCLTTLPEVLGSSLSNLAELYLGCNNFGEGKDWRWIVNRNLSKRLKLLDLSANKIKTLPDKLVNLENLVTLKLDYNYLKTLPKGIGCLKKLRYLSLSHNKLAHLPRSFFSLQLDSVDVSDNYAFCEEDLENFNVEDCLKFCTERCQKLKFEDFQQVPALLDLAATCVMKKRLKYSAETLPLTLIDHLETVPYCICGNPCFSLQPESYIPYQNFKSPSSLVFSRNFDIPVAVRFCSFICYSRYGKQQTMCRIHI